MTIVATAAVESLGYLTGAAVGLYLWYLLARTVYRKVKGATGSEQDAD